MFENVTIKIDKEKYIIDIKEFPNIDNIFFATTKDLMMRNFWMFLKS